MDDRLQAYGLLIADVYELAGASRETGEGLAREVGQTAARWHVMSVISAEDLSVPTVARRLGLARQSVQRVVNDLAEQRLVSLRPNPDHQRSPLVSLNDEGRTLMGEMFSRAKASRLALLSRAGISADELLQARKVIASLVAAFER